MNISDFKVTVVVNMLYPTMGKSHDVNCKGLDPLEKKILNLSRTFLVRWGQIKSVIVLGMTWDHN